MDVGRGRPRLRRIASYGSGLFSVKLKGIVELIISGGQSGADQAALDWAIVQGISHGGCCPKGRKAEDGIMDRRYALKETPRADYVQ